MCYCVCLYETLVYSFVGVEWIVYFDLRLHIHPRLNIAAHVNQGRQETEKLINSRKHSLHSHGDEPVRRIIGNSYCHAGLLTNWQLHPTSVMQCTLVQTKQAIRRSCSSYFCELRTHKGETRKQNWAGCCSIPFVCDTFVEWQAAAICYASKAGFQDLSAKGIQSHPLNHTPTTTKTLICPGWETAVVPVSQPGQKVSFFFMFFFSQFFFYFNYTFSFQLNLYIGIQCV